MLVYLNRVFNRKMTQVFSTFKSYAKFTDKMTQYDKRIRNVAQVVWRKILTKSIVIV